MRTKNFDYTIDYGFCEPEKHNLYLVADNYSNNDTLAIIVMETTDEGYDEQFDVITVNLPFGYADETHAYIDTNNCSWAEKML